MGLRAENPVQESKRVLHQALDTATAEAVRLTRRGDLEKAVRAVMRELLKPKSPFVTAVKNIIRQRVQNTFRVEKSAKIANKVEAERREGLSKHFEHFFQGKPPAPNRSITNLGLSSETVKALKGEGIDVLHKLLRFKNSSPSYMGLVSIRGIGEQREREIEICLRVIHLLREMVR